MEVLLAIDQGTTGTKVLAVNRKLEVLAEASNPFEQHFPQPGWVEHDLNQIWASVVEGLKSVLAKINPKDIVGIGITNQRETVCFWDRATTAPLAHAIVWQDRRTAADCDELKKRSGLESRFQDRTGLLLDPYFSGTKVGWALKNWPDVKTAQKKGKLAIGTIDSYLIARLSGGAAHVTEPSNASRTLCFTLKEKKWDLDLCATLGIPEDLWPEVRPSTGIFAKTKGVAGLPDGIPISGVLGDQQSALLGQACISEGTAKCTYGTGAFMLMNTGATPVKSHCRLLTTIAWVLEDGTTCYALEGSAFIAGAATQWLRDGLGIIKNSEDIEVLAMQEPSSDGVVFVPALAGLGAPYWDPYARGILTGLTRGSNKAHIARAVLEGIAFQNADILIAMQKDMGRTLARLNVDGGASRNNLLMQFQADILGCNLVRPKMTETTSLGAVFAAGLGIGIWKKLEDIESSWKEEITFYPKISESDRGSTMERWHRAVKQSLAHT